MPLPNAFQLVEPVSMILVEMHTRMRCTTEIPKPGTRQHSDILIIRLTCHSTLRDIHSTFRPLHGSASALPCGLDSRVYPLGHDNDSLANIRLLYHTEWRWRASTEEGVRHRPVRRPAVPSRPHETYILPGRRVHQAREPHWAWQTHIRSCPVQSPVSLCTSLTFSQVYVKRVWISLAGSPVLPVLFFTHRNTFHHRKGQGLHSG